jgi:hypothetical protein
MGHCVARGELTTVSADAWRATKSTTNRKKAKLPGRSSMRGVRDPLGKRVYVTVYTVEILRWPVQPDSLR